MASNIIDRKPAPRVRKEGERVKTIRPDVAHRWAHGLNLPGREKEDSRGILFAEGDTLYSYGYHFPIARRVPRTGGRRPVFLFNPNTYSPTTSKHQRAAVSATRDVGETFDVDRHLWDVLTGEGRESEKRYSLHVSARATYWGNLWKNRGAGDYRTPERREELYRSARVELGELVAAAYALRGETAGKRLSRTVDKALEPLAAVVREESQRLAEKRAKVRAGVEARRAEREEENRKKWAAWEAAEPERAAARKREEETREAKRAELDARRAELQACWKRGDTFPALVSTGKTPDVFDVFPYTHHGDAGDVLRIKPGEPGTVQTSRGVKVPTADVFAVLDRIPTLWAGEPRTVAVTIGGYGPVVLEEGCLRVGCHRFAWTEVNRFRAELPREAATA